MRGNYSVTKTSYGLYIKFEGRLCRYDIKEWFEEFKTLVDTLTHKFSIILDVRYVQPICTDTARILTYARSYLHGKGLLRLAIVYSTSATIMQLMENFNELGQHENERHISSMMNKNWNESAENWVKKGIEP